MTEVDAQKLQEAVQILRTAVLFPEQAEIVPAGIIARIAVNEADAWAVWLNRDVLVPAILEAGFEYAVLDLKGR